MFSKIEDGVLKKVSLNVTLRDGDDSSSEVINVSNHITEKDLCQLINQKFSKHLRGSPELQLGIPKHGLVFNKYSELKVFKKMQVSGVFIDDDIVQVSNWHKLNFTCEVVAEPEESNTRCCNLL